MKLKPGVRILGVKPELALALVVIESVCYRLFGNAWDPTLTACVDGTHHPSSCHYKGLAFDMRSHDLPAQYHLEILRQALQDALGPDFDVILEDAGTENEHIHLEFDPKDPL